MPKLFLLITFLQNKDFFIKCENIGCMSADISDFNPDEILINQIKFKTLAVVFHYEITEEVSHFVCFKRIKNYWLNISDEISSVYENLNSLKRVYYIFLEKTTNKNN